MGMPKHPLTSVSQVSILLHNLNKEAERTTGLSIVQWSILKHVLEMPGTSAQELSEAAGLHPSTLSQSLKLLIRKEFILVIEDPRDSRKKIISLARNGKSMLDQAQKPMDEIASKLAPVEKELYALEECLSSLRYQPEEDMEGMSN